METAETVPIEIQTGSRHTAEIEKAFLEHHELVYRAAFRITGNAPDAEDVLQTLFLKLVRRDWTPDEQCGWSAYLHRAAVNISLDIVRSRGRQVPIDGNLERTAVDARPDQYREQSSSELRHWFEAALTELSPAAAEMFVLRHVEGYGNRDIARMLRTTHGVVAVTLFRARNRLRKSIRKLRGER